jgi:capsule polysaccharide export protein KpsE/RkpR
LTNIFLEKHRTLKEGQSNDVLCYFEEATATAELRLKEEEKKLLNFRTSNNIINYYEQTRFIADNKEDLDDLYFKEEMALQASKSTKDRLDEQLEERGLLSELNGKLLIKRNELSNVTNKLAMYEFLADDQKISKADLVHWETQRDYLTSEIREIAIKTQSLNFSQEGVALRDLLTEWLKAVIQIEESISRLSVINKRKQQFTQIYQQFAPWGSQLKKIERKIALAEEAYLENLHSYNQARLHLQNTLMSTNLKIIEAPYYPKSDEGSKRYMMIALAFLCGLLLPLTFLVAMEYLDQTLKNPIDAANRLELPLAGVFPLIRPKINWVPGGSKLDFIALRTRSANLIAKNLIFRSHTIKSRPNFIAISSIRGKEGASYVGNHIVRTFRSQDPVLYIVPEKKNIDLPLGDNTLTYKPSELLITVKILSKFIKKKGKKIKRYKYIVFELPSLIHNIFPATLIKQIDQMFIVCRSNRVWTNADQQIWNSLNDVLKYSPQLIINGVSPDIMEEFIGELPKKRSFIRKKIKEYIKFNFSGSSSLS